MQNVTVRKMQGWLGKCDGGVHALKDRIPEGRAALILQCTLKCNVPPDDAGGVFLFLV